ncbi:MAG: helix-turn-helix domain-containing protein [Candidatus Omnitrophica bacterium]|nr:helix-turn-helix domain-containing protein [Candidatus Omnitrophota bacterium]
MKSEELKLIIKEGEGLTVEFKEKFTSKIDRDVIALANSKGGLILLGVNDSGKITGEKLTNRIKADITTLARNCEPAIHIKRIQQIDKIIIVEVPQGDEKPYSSSSGYYRRLDAVTQKMTQKEVRLFFRETDMVSFESLACNKVNVKDISLSKVKDFLKEAGTSLKVSKTNLAMVLSSLGALDKNKANNAGALMFASNVAKVIPHSESILGAFKGTNKTHIFDRKDVRDDLLTQFNEAVVFLKKHLNIRSEIRGVNRYDIYEIPLDALREAVVNAIIHRDYSIKGTSIYVMVYDDRVEIENPGKLLSGVTVKNLDKSSVRRNPIIADLFHRMGKVERLGSGIKRMRDLMREAGLKEPVFKIDPFFRVIFYRDLEYSLKRPGWGVEKTAQKTTQKPAQKTTQKQRDILVYLSKHPKAGREEIAGNVKGISESGVKYNLRVLQDKKLLKRIGSARGGHWQVVER